MGDCGETYLSDYTAQNIRNFVRNIEKELETVSYRLTGENGTELDSSDDPMPVADIITELDSAYEHSFVKNFRYNQEAGRAGFSTDIAFCSPENSYDSLEFMEESGDISEQAYLTVLGATKADKEKLEEIMEWVTTPPEGKPGIEF